MMNVYGKSRDADGAKRAEELLRSMQSDDDLTPNSTSYNICIDAYARRGDHARAKSLLDEMIAVSEDGENTRPTIHSFAAVVSVSVSRDVIKCVMISPSLSLFLLLDVLGECPCKV
jgi:pentatricopeptide repeat protein